MMQDLIKDLARLDKMLFVVGGGGCVSEMYGDGKTEPRFQGQWGMVETERWHFHLDLGRVKSAQFVEAEDHGAPVMYYVRFADEAGDTLLRCYFPNPYLDDDEKVTEFQPERLRVFEDYRDRHVGKEGIVFVKRPKDG